jgi:DNA-binding MarR family transcriptional regulator
LSQTALGRRLLLEKSTISRLVGQLDARGWIERGKDPGDARATLLTLTSNGMKAAESLLAAREAKFAALVAAIPHDQRPDVLHALKILTEAVT